MRGGSGSKAVIAHLLLLAWLIVMPAASHIAAAGRPTIGSSADTKTATQTIVGHPSGCNPLRLDCPPSLSYRTFRAVWLAHATKMNEADIAFAYQDGVKWHIDPAWMLAIWAKESTCASRGGISLSHLNGGNVKAPDGSYRYYASWQAAIDDWYRRMRLYYVDRGAVYIWQVVYIYAPSGVDGNQPAVYLRQIEGWLARWRAEDKKGGK